MPKKKAPKKREPAKARHVKVRLTVPMSLTEAVTDVLWDLDVIGVTVDDDETRARPYDPAIPKTGLATIDGTFEHKRGLESRVLKALQGVLQLSEELGTPASLQWDDVEEKDWNEEWKKRWSPLQVSDRVWIVPSWEKDAFTVPDGALALYMDPGMAFGTGTHETTQLCCQEIERVLRERTITSVLDVGTGSGILAMVADKLARQMGKPLKRNVGVDIDPDSVRTAKENADINGVVLDVSATPVAELREPFEMVVANILLDPLKGMKEHLKRLTTENGVLVMSGILEAQRPALEEAFNATGMKKVHHHVIGEWAVVRYVHAR